jgi:hypothetical protein
MGLSNDPTIHTTYTWNLGNGTTATGPGPITTVYTGAGPYTVTLTVTAPFGVCTSAFRVTPTQGGGCCSAGIAASNLLGVAGNTTTLLPGTYSGTYRVLGDPVLTNGVHTYPRHYLLRGWASQYDAAAAGNGYDHYARN